MGNATAAGQRPHQGSGGPGPGSLPAVQIRLAAVAVSIFVAACVGGSNGGAGEAPGPAPDSAGKSSGGSGGATKPNPGPAPDATSPSSGGAPGPDNSAGGAVGQSGQSGQDAGGGASGGTTGSPTMMGADAAAGQPEVPAATAADCPSGRKMVFRLDFSQPNWNGGKAGVEAAIQALGSSVMYGPDHASVVVDPEHGHVLKVDYPAGSGSGTCVAEKKCSTAGGFVFRAPLPDGNAISSAVLSYWVKFDSTFEWIKGGKLPGLCGGECATGGLDVSPDRFSIRYMWRGGGVGMVYAYLSNPPNPGFGLDMGVGTWRWQADGKWHRIQEELILNTANNTDGIIRVWYDKPISGPPNFEQKNLRYYDRTKYPNLGIDKLIFSTFHGGQDASWSPKRGSTAYFADLQVCR